jgi:hypothetical protein
MRTRNGSFYGKEILKCIISTKNVSNPPKTKKNRSRDEHTGSATLGGEHTSDLEGRFVAQARTYAEKYCPYLGILACGRHNGHQGRKQEQSQPGVHSNYV